MDERCKSVDDTAEAMPTRAAGAGYVIRVAAEGRKYHDWELIGPTGAYLLGSVAFESHTAALENAYRLQSTVYPGADVQVAPSSDVAT